jgi:hypothetical protein
MEFPVARIASRRAEWRRRTRCFACCVERLESRAVFADLVGAALGPAVVPPQWVVNHSPRLQPGNAPLAGYAGSEFDRVDVLWQTMPAGAGTEDSFTVDYRAAGAGAWTAAAINPPIDTGVGGRAVRSASITGLAWNAAYEYRVRHLRAGGLVAEYAHDFRTRLAVGDSAPFSFVAYGDSASPSPAGFRAVQARINQIDPSFAVLLGDNVYDVGSHAESDSRFDPDVNPEAATWMAGHVDYLGLGNHDVATGSGLPSEQNYSVPIPIAGVTAPAAPPASERPEHSYSWDYGNVHFVTFDTNSLSSTSRLDGLLDWVVADLAASNATWKIVYGHHPLAGVPDKPESPGGNYYQQVVNRLKAAGADLFMTGHSHTYSWTYPLTGQVEGVATFADHGEHDHFHAGEGLPQLVSGVGGVGIRSGDYSGFPFVAAGFTSSTATVARLGFSKIDVTPSSLVVSYIAADDGSTIDSFTIAKEAVQTVSFQQGVGGYAGVFDTFLHENTPSTSFAAAASLKVDDDNPTGTGLSAQAMLRFQDIFGDAAGKIPRNAILRSATLELSVTNGGDSINLHRMATDWSPLDTWNSRVGGIQADGREAVAFPDVSTGRIDTGTLSFDVLASVEAWRRNPAANRGWALLPTGSDGVDFDSAEAAVAPKLVVTYVVSGAAAIDPPRFIVADGGSATAFGYAAAGAPVGSSAIQHAAAAPRGIAASPDGSRIWVLGSGGVVSVHDASMKRLGSWTAGGLAKPTGIALAGRDLYMTDASARRVLVFADAVGRLSGSLAATRSFLLAPKNTNAQDLATDGTTVWVVQPGDIHKVFVYRADDGIRLGTWTLDTRNRRATGIALDPTGASQSLWVVDANRRRVFEYAGGRSFTSGIRRAFASFALSAANLDPQAITDPPSASSRVRGSGHLKAGITRRA